MTTQKAPHGSSGPPTRLLFIRILLVAFVIIAIAPRPMESRTWYIKPDGTGDAPTIMAGVDSIMGHLVSLRKSALAVNAGDTILLAPGTFSGLGNFEITNLGMSIVFTSEAGPESTTIDCQGLGRGFTVPWDGPVMISGITIENGDALNDPAEGFGGGILGGSAITNCILRNNHADERGGGIYCWGTATVSKNVVVDNTSNVCGGIYFVGNAVVTENTVIGNHANIQGGGVGGYSTDGFTAIVSHNIVKDNTAFYLGGGIACGDNVTVTDNLVVGNSCDNSGGGIVNVGNATITNNIVTGNTALQSGGGIFSSGWDPTIIRNTICENHAPQGAGVAFSEAPSQHVEANIIAFNYQGAGTACLDNGGAWFICCNVYGNEGGDGICGEDERCNFSLDPQFCGIPGSGNYYLQSDSPCAPGNHPGGFNCGQIGAKPVACGTVPNKKLTWGSLKEMYKD